MLVAAIVLRARSWIPADTSWLLTLGSQYLDGRTIYRDVIEVNPPASMLLYLPAVKLARALSIRPEFTTTTLVILAGLISAVSSIRLLRKTALIPGRHVAYYHCAAIAILLILPGSDFTQREHIALILLVPALAAIMARTCDKPVPTFFALAAGLCVGIAVSIKPHFALGYGPMVAWAVWRKKSLAPVWALENLCAATIVLAYVSIVFLCFPEFVRSVLPVLRDVYLPVRVSTATLLLSPSMLLIALLMVLTLAVAQGHISQSLALPALLGTAGFSLVAIIQGKGWLYHFYPALSLGMMAALIVIAEGWNTVRARRIAGLGLIATFLLSTWQYTRTYDYAELFATLKAVAPAHPRILAASADIKDGHPITRWLDGTWVGSSSALWMAAGAAYVLNDRGTALTQADRTRLAHYAQLEAMRFASDVRHGHPDIVLVSESGRDWISANRIVTEALKSYREVGRVNGISILRSLASGPPAAATG